MVKLLQIISLEYFRSGAVVYLNNKHKVEYMDKITQKTDKILTSGYFAKQKGRTWRPFVLFADVNAD
ncbi:hypothetical protein BCT38_17945 [Vibrio lentus]|nr:hypothetical protein BH583_22565 [Vibrio lentus]PMN14374.1 hypothetical protein BCT38_17945 [Vibrio lentus]